MRYWTRFGEIGVSLKLLTLGRNGQGVQCVHDQIVVSIPLRAQSPLRTLDRGRIGGRADRQGCARASVGAARNAVRGTCDSPAPSRSRRVETGSRSEEHTSELQSLMRISYAVFCLKQ